MAGDGGAHEGGRAVGPEARGGLGVEGGVRGFNGKVEKKADPAPEAKVAKATEATQQQKVICHEGGDDDDGDGGDEVGPSETSASLEESGTVWKKKKTSD